MDAVALEAEKLLANMKPPKPSVEVGASLLPDETRLDVAVSGGTVAVWRTVRPRVLLVHGWNDDHRVWRKLAGHFSSTDQAFALMDLPGHGVSQTPDFTYPFAGKAIELACAELGSIDTVIAHSFGCVAAIRAIECGAQIRKLVLIAPSIPDLERGWLNYHRHKGVSEPVLAKAAQIFEARYGVPLKPYDAAAAIGAFQGRVLVIASEDDEVCNIDVIRRFAAGLPDGELETVDSASHRDITADDRVTNLLGGFLGEERG